MEYLDTEGVVAFKGTEPKLLKSRATQTAGQLRNLPDRIRPPPKDKEQLEAWYEFNLKILF